MAESQIRGAKPYVPLSTAGRSDAVSVVISANENRGHGSIRSDTAVKYIVDVQMVIRKEQPEDYDPTDSVVKKAFMQAEYSDKT